jgi:hypothetical protein
VLVRARVRVRVRVRVRLRDLTREHEVLERRSRLT